MGADAWRRTGVLTFDGNRTRGKQVTYKAIQDHLQEKYWCKIGYGTVVQLVSYEVSAASLRKGTRAWLKLHAGNQERGFP